MGEVTRTLLHEIFIYVIAFYLKKRDNDALSYVLSKTYFVSGDAQSFNIFYDHNENFDRAVSKRDGKRYYSGTANYWVNSII